jgi:Zn-dependent protease
VGSLLNTKFPVFKVSGIQVYVHIMFLLYAIWQVYELRETPGFGVLVVCCVYGCVLLHEFGHCWGARYQGGDATEVLIWPLGGLALCEAPMTPWSQGFVAASGPAVNLVLFGITYGLSFVVPKYSEPMWRTVGFQPGDITNVLMSVNAMQFLFNVLLPAFPLDGGRIFQAIVWVWKGFSRSLRIACYTSFVCCAGLVGWWIVDQVAPNLLSHYVGGLTLIIAIWIGQTAYNELQKLNAGYFDELDEPWRETFRYHPTSEPIQPKEDGFMARWAKKRAEAKAAKEAEETEARSARLDEVLRRVNEVGTGGLTPDEKAFLDAESARLREKR